MGDQNGTQAHDESARSDGDAPASESERGRAVIAAPRSGALGVGRVRRGPTPAARWADVRNTVRTPHTGGAARTAAPTMLGLLEANLAAFFATGRL